MELELLNKKVWAVAGANQNPDKYGNMIYKRLKEKGYEVYAVNPMYNSIEGDMCYANLTSLPALPEVVCMVVSPQRALPILEEASELGIKYIWFQPDTYDDDALSRVKELNLTAVYACVLVATRLYK
ncbi:CoA-binding protein [bacterium]|nr:CoA-binding protein [bacterium]